ncbi:MAG TPA: hypothetical protein H9903_04700 [Candidatus Aquabacterium excrementipullorum]|nr:hypothetical protein [Candidatus Aquabacterium excrementipullorum]
MGITPSKDTRQNADKVSRGPNEEAVDTAQENVSEGYGASGKAGIISGQPDGDTQGGPGANNDQGRAPPKTPH